MKAFIWNDVLYIRCIPAKSLFRSTMIHDVTTRGDIFALRVSDQALTIVPGLAVVTHLEVDCTQREKVDTVTVSKMKKEVRQIADVLRQIDLELS